MNPVGIVAGCGLLVVSIAFLAAACFHYMRSRDSSGAWGIGLAGAITGALSLLTIAFALEGPQSPCIEGTQRVDRIVQMGTKETTSACLTPDQITQLVTSGRVSK